MKHTKKLLAFLLCALTVLSLAACNKEQRSTEELWKDAVYTEDKTFGEGEKTVNVKVTAGERSVVFTLNTDKATLGEALAEHGLVEGEEGQFGLYVKKVNGILADYDIDQSYWGVSRDGVELMNGIDAEDILGGESYELARKK